MNYRSTTYQIPSTKHLFTILSISFFISCAGFDSDFVSVESGHFSATLVESGELQAVNYMTVAMPPFHWDYGQPKVTALAKEGLIVKTGDVVGQIETSGVTRSLGQKQSDLEIAQADLAKMQVEHQTQIKQVEAEILSAEAQFRIAEIGVEQVKFESQGKQEKAGLELKIAEIGLRKAREKAQATKRTQTEDLTIQQAKLAQIQSAIRNAQRTLDRFTLRAPAEGMVEYRRNRRTRKKAAVGDQFWQGQPILGLPDLRQMKVLTTVNETDIKKIYLGQPATIRLDAFPKRDFEGAVSKISRVSREKEEKSLIKVFDVEILMKQSDPILRPGMTVSSAFLVADFETALYVNPAGIHQNATGAYVVYVKDGSGVRQVPITLGPRNPEAVVIQGPLQAGDQVALSPPEGEA